MDGISDWMLGLVMLPLLVTSVVGTILILERLWFWRRILNRQDTVVRAVLTHYAQHPHSVLDRLQKNADLPISRIFLAALTLPEATPEEFRIALESAAQGELPLLQRFATALNTIAAIAPLLGLLGTIVGLIQALSGVEWGMVGAEDASQVIAGISGALLSTGAGLVIAIATLIFANFFQGVYRRQRAFLQEASGQLELHYRRHYRRLMQQSRDRSASSAYPGSLL